MFEHGDLVGADRQRRRVRQRRREAEAARDLDDLRAAELGRVARLGSSFWPSAIDNLTGTTLIERVIAWVSVTGPE